MWKPLELLDVTPSVAPEHFLHSAGGYAVTQGQIGCLAALGADSEHIGFGQFCSMVIRSAVERWRLKAPSVSAILHIIAARSRREMSGVAAQSVIAFVSRVLSSFECAPKLDLQHNAMRVNAAFPSPAKRAVAILFGRPRPRPAFFAFAHINLVDGGANQITKNSALMRLQEVGPTVTAAGNRVGFCHFPSLTHHWADYNA